MTDRGTNTLVAHRAGGTFFQLCCCVSFLVLGEIVFGVSFVLILQNSCGVVLIFGSDEIFIFNLHMYLSTILLCSCVSFLIVARNSSQNENTF